MTAWIDWILLGMAAEAAVLLFYHRWTGRGVHARALLPNLLAGAALLAAMRLALSGAAWPFVSAALLAGLLAHLLDLRGRWQA